MTLSDPARWRRVHLQGDKNPPLPPATERRPAVARPAFFFRGLGRG